MNCWRLWGPLLIGHRGVGQGLAVYGQCRVPTSLRECAIHARLYRTDHRHDTFLSRLKKGLQQHSAGISRACARQVRVLRGYQQFYLCQ